MHLAGFPYFRPNCFILKPGFSCSTPVCDAVYGRACGGLRLQFIQQNDRPRRKSTQGSSAATSEIDPAKLYLPLLLSCILESSCLRVVVVIALLLRPRSIPPHVPKLAMLRDNISSPASSGTLDFRKRFECSSAPAWSHSLPAAPCDACYVCEQQ